jgi:hypothetical protein
MDNIYEVLQKYKDINSNNKKLDGKPSHNEPIIKSIIKPIREPVSDIYEVLKTYRYICKPVNKTLYIKSIVESIVEPVIGPTINPPINKQLGGTKQVVFNEKLNEIRVYNNRIEEIQEVLHNDGPDDSFKNRMIIEYALDLQGFKELVRFKRLKRKEVIFIKYININGKLGYGGYFVSFDNDSIRLMDNYDKPFNISIDDNFIFYKRIV